jgi:hypothetical protein
MKAKWGIRMSHKKRHIIVLRLMWDYIQACMFIFIKSLKCHTRFPIRVFSTCFHYGLLASRHKAVGLIWVVFKTVEEHCFIPSTYFTYRYHQPAVLTISDFLRLVRLC